ncbi:MAG: glycosyltransferase family 4 protein, partial [Burkholderiaceae bacterium]|nr:glycosyltransferase family 4 protein [Burkholderiaceae bacterium]
VAGNRVLVPRLAQVHEQTRRDDDAGARDAAQRELTRLYLTSFQALLFFALPVFALAIAGAGVLSLLTRGVFDTHLVHVFVLVLPAWFVFCIADPVINLKMGAGRMGLVLTAHGAMLVLLPLLALAAFAETLPAMRGMAIIAAASGAIVLPCGWLLWRHHRDERLPLAALSPGRVLLAILLAGGSAIFVASRTHSVLALGLGWAGAAACTLVAMRLLPAWSRLRAMLRRAPLPGNAPPADGVLRVLVLHSSAAQYGSDNALAELLCGLKRRLGARFEAIVVLPEDGPLVARLRADGIETVQQPLAVLHRSLSPLFWLRFAWSLWRGSRRLAALARERRVQLVHSNTSHVLNGAAVSRLAGIPHLWHVREMNLWRGRIGRIVAARVARAQEVAFVSNATREVFCAAGHTPARACVLYDGVRTDRFDHGLRDAALRAGWGFGDAHFVIGLVGRIVFWKGQREFIEAAHAVHRACPQARFVIVGSALTPADRAYEAGCRARVDALGLAGALHFAGQSSEVARVMASLDALVLATTQGEPWGLVVLEGMASSLPVVATAAGGPLEMLREGEGLLVPPGDASALAGALIGLVGQPDAAREMGRRARDAVTHRLSIERTLDDAEALYRRVAARGTATDSAGR